ncbi:MAG: hypothetical protein ACI9P5_001808 [Saprospiraceae bacterium]|jgi:hypothetical protein|tara:strand:+ start:3197 stop:3706 length:510 start_codon:yes stop_codon:yes gene_type:complete
MAETLVNRVANSGIITINLEQYYPESEFVQFDLKDFLYMELILKEKDFRQSLKEIDWNAYQDKILLIYCSNDAIIPLWAYMLVASHAEVYAKETYAGNQEAYLNHHYQTLIEDLDLSSYAEKRIVIKGCSNKPVPAGAYQSLTRRLKPITLSIMFGEPCSMVPIYKRPK